MTVVGVDRIIENFHFEAPIAANFNRGRGYPLLIECRIPPGADGKCYVFLLSFVLCVQVPFVLA
ncbi:MAG: hypothetical protein KIC84_16980 [Dysgonomonas mossii]|uniref:hypothetical protein n=1 Tax=Dysgonomonas mossii TaxID=163665 RepID=UPI0026EEFE4F|nr:hypothetical protein [Dysgonomonas mossii]MBS5908900.1 hypothetical protein [Dysgonomonas mossii]